MSFIQSVFIRENTPELRQKLKYLGFEIIMDIGSNCLLIQRSAVVEIFSETALEDLKNNGVIDCETNKELFLSLAALRDDSDFMQWFIVTTMNGIEWVKSGEDRFTGDAAHSIWRKATVEEIIEHFKDK